MKHSVQDRGTLLLALIAGLSINGTFAALFSSIVPFSIFPILSLVLTVYCLHQRYQNRSMPVGLPGLAAACFILGVLVYSTVVRAEYPDIGSNFFPAVLSVIMVFWIGYRLRNRKNAVAGIISHPAAALLPGFLAQLYFFVSSTPHSI
ncbi:inner membrane protein [Klebsiella michiganensis]|nr:inner membrane protein [Klebsiella michiganensis]